jgi:hypothetical protein
MFHAIAFFPFDRDLLSPLLNLLLATVAVLAAYCMGRRRGLGAMCVAASALVLGLPGLVGTHPGQATNDVLCATFLLLAVALLVEGGIEPVPLALAGAASALSLGTKLTVAVPIAVLTVAVVVVAFRRRRVALVLAWLLPLGALGAFWFVRNWVLVDNPLPFYDLRLGPLHLPQRMHLDDDASVAEHLFDGHVWSSVFRPGLRQAFGPVWPLVVAAPGAAGLLVVGRRRTTAERLAGLVAVAAGLGYVLMPFTMELGGAVFAATARYAAPALLVGAVLLPGALWADRWQPVARAVAAVGIIGVVVADAVVENVDRFAPWWEPDRLNAIVIVAVALALVAVARRGGLTGRWVVGPLVVVVVVLGGVAVQRHYLERRYAAGAGLALDHADEYVSAAPPARVAPFSTIQFYPLFGPSFANRVLVLTPPIEDPPPDPATRCREWERALRTRRVDLVVDGDAVSFVERPDRSWFRDPSLRPVAHDGASVVYRARGPVHLACPVG